MLFSISCKWRALFALGLSSFVLNGCLYRGESPNLVLNNTVTESTEVVDLKKEIMTEQKIEVENTTPEARVASLQSELSEENEAWEDEIGSDNLNQGSDASGYESIAGVDGLKGNFAGIAIIWPVKQGKLSSHFGMRHRKLHAGLDISAPKGTPVLAVADGVVLIAQRQKGYGNMIVVEHGKNRKTLYAHLDKFEVKAGDAVAVGEVIGKVGRTGRATGNHLHFETRMEKGIPRDPLLFLPAETLSKPELSALDVNSLFSKFHS